MTELPRRAVIRTAKLAALPLGFAGRTTIGLGKRIGGRPAEIVAAEVQARTAEQLFKVLGELKGGAMKFGQAMSVFEAALPENLAGPYRETLTRLQESAPPLPARSVHAVLARELGPDWRALFTSFQDKPAAAASIGQVHRAVWLDGRAVAVKVQYPGAGQALLSDLNQIGRMSRLVGMLVPGLDVKPLIAELKARVAEELDYALEAESQTTFATAYADDPDVLVPSVVHQSGQVLVSEWVDGKPLARIIASGTVRERNRAGLLLSRFLFSGPQRAGLLHADPHPGNFRLLEDGRLVVLDFGAVNRLPGGLPEPIGRLLRLAIDDDAQGVLDGLRAEGFVKRSIDLDARRLLDFLGPILDPVRADSFRFDRAWLRAQATRIADPRSPAYNTGLQLNLPPEYLLIHRVTMGTIGVLCQLRAEAAWRTELEHWLPDFDGTPGVDPGVIIWLNGTFGVGKTTISEELLATLANTRIFDPESVGELLMHHLADAPTTDFQHWPAWRRLVVATAAELVGQTGQHLIAPQTVLRESYWAQILRGLANCDLKVFHVLLDAEESTLRERILGSDNASAWRLRHLEDYQQARSWLMEAADLVVDTTSSSPADVTRCITEALPAIDG